MTGTRLELLQAGLAQYWAINFQGVAEETFTTVSQYKETAKVQIP
jgi:hypothetical protein